MAIEFDEKKWLVLGGKDKANRFLKILERLDKLAIEEPGITIDEALDKACKEVKLNEQK